MNKVTCKLSIGQWSVDTADDARTELISLETFLSMGSPHDICRITLSSPPAAEAGGLEQLVTEAAGALGLTGEASEGFSVGIRGSEVKEGDEISVELASGEVSGLVMTAEVRSVDSSLGQTRITGQTGMVKLTGTCLNQVYENQSLSQIVGDMAGQADVAVGEVETGSTYPYLVVHESRNIYSIIRDLAMGEGVDMYFDTENRLDLKTFTKTGPDHSFFYGIDILDLRVSRCRMSRDHIIVRGESPASNQGSDVWHWIAKDLSSFTGEAGGGAAGLALHSGPARTKDAAQTLAASKFGAIKDGSTCGTLKILGNPAVKLGDAVEIPNALKPDLNGLFKVTGVRHVMSKCEGYVTYVGLIGIGGAEAAAGGLLGAVAGLL
jgi:hypothetical protein